MDKCDKNFPITLTNELFTHLASFAGDNARTVHDEICERLKESAIQDLKAANPSMMIDGETGDITILDYHWTPAIGMLVTTKVKDGYVNPWLYYIKAFSGSMDNPLAMLRNVATTDEFTCPIDQIEPYKANRSYPHVSSHS